MGYSPEDDRFWTERGIDPTVRDARPYTRYYEDDISAVQAAYTRLPNAGQRATTTRKGKVADGLLIMRHPVLPGLPEVFPELRPDKAISTATPRRHWHGHGEPPEDGRYYEKINPDSEPGRAHLAKHHKGGNTDEVHETSSPGKYHFPPNGRRSVVFEHTHEEAYGGIEIRVHSKYSNHISKAERRRLHIEKYHGGADPDGAHEHTVSRPDPDENLARRLDVHPWGAPLFEDAKEVFFGIEGCLKADAILTAINRERRKAAVFSVPSVTLWDAEELPQFARERLQGKLVAVVPDADWTDNERVIEQARLCRTYLHRFGVEAVVAAPPLRDGAVEHKGVDDYLGAGGTLDGLAVQHRGVPERAIQDYLRQFFLAKNKYARGAEMLFALSAHASPQGRFYGTLARFAKVLGVGPRRVARAIEDLEGLGAISISGDLAIRKMWFTRGWGWGPDNPVITLRPELCGWDEAAPLGELAPELVNF